MSRPLSVRVSNMEFEQIESVKLSKETMSQTVRRLIMQAVKGEREDIEGWKDLVARIEKSDLSELSRKLDMILEILERRQTWQKENS